MSWLISKALMNSLCSQELVAESLEENFSDGEQSALSNGNNIQQAYCAPDKMTGFSRLSRFGITYKPLTETRGEELLTLYLEDFHAKTLVQREKAQELTEKPLECGEKWHGSFTKFDQDTSLWKTHQCSLLGDLDEFSETWPQWGLMRDGECWEQQTLAQTIRGTESGSLENKEMWPTPVKSDYAARRPSKGWKGMSDLPSVVWTKNGGKENPNKPPAKLNARWVEWLMGWPQGWTKLNPLATDKFLYVPQLPGES
jgi:hypothetical protein